ncbi:B12-binding domain-containing radical SAM protein [Planctomycetota bacterium]
MATFARRRGFSVEILDANAEALDATAAAERITARAPRLAAIVVYGHNPSASIQVMPAAGAIARTLKERARGQPLLFVGGYVAALPERTLREEAADFACSGEGPITVAELLAALAAGDDLGSVRGLVFRDGAETRTNPPAPLILDLDADMPGVAWDLLPMAAYRAHNWHCFGEPSRTPYAALYTTLGCPFHCTFCCIQAPFRAGERALGMRPGSSSSAAGARRASSPRSTPS